MKAFFTKFSVQYFAKATKSATIVVLVLLGLVSKSWAQNILFVNDNNNILYNTDTIRTDMNNTIYSSYHYWSVPDSAFTVPDSAYMATFDLVIWYCSTDGVGLSFWNGSTSANPVIVSYASSGKPIWIIGQDILYQLYTEGSVFASTDFASKFMGLTSYDVQSYIDDTSSGLPEADRMSTASSLFPNTLKWVFPTLWYADGCTPNAGTKEIYEMGPSSYALYGRVCMFHKHQDGYSVMSTFFDPALIDSFSNRVNFLEKGITYLLGGTEIKNTTVNNNSIAFSYFFIAVKRIPHS